MKKKQTQFSEEEQWLAFRYVAGELSVADAEAFELRMLDDPRLCDAVVQSGLLATAVASVDRKPAAVAVPVAKMAVGRTVPRVSRNPQAAIASIVAVCCCVAVVLLTSRLATRDLGGESVVSAALAETGDVEVLVDVWADGISDGAEVESLESDMLSDDLDVPGWMMAAVSLDVEEASASELSPADRMQDDMELF